MYLNKALIIGNLTRDPELKALPSGLKVCSLNVATNRTYKDKDGQKQDATEYHNVTAFSKLGELAGQYLKKGQSVLVEGRIQTRSWDGQDGVKRYRTEIIAENIQFGYKSQSSSQTNSVPASKDSQEQNPVAGDQPAGEKINYPEDDINPEDIPF